MISLYNVFIREYNVYVHDRRLLGIVLKFSKIN